MKRKRGRPTKAEVQARIEAQSSSSALGPATPQGRVHTPMSVSIPPSPGADLRTSSNMPAVTRGIPISAMITTTPAAQTSGSHSSSSSGKRRRRRRSDEVFLGAQQTPQSAPTHLSSTGQLRPSYDDTPARTASLRRRDESIHASVTRLDVSEPEQAAGPHTTTSSIGDV